MPSFGWLIPRCSTFDENDIEKIIQTALRILEKSEWTIDGTAQFMAYLDGFGCSINEKKVRFPQPVIDKTLARINAFKASQPPDSPLNEIRASTELLYSTSGQAIYTCDVETGALRAATTDDLADISRVINSYERLGRTHPTFIPQDAPLMTRELHAFITIMLNSDQPYRVSAFSPQIVPFFLEALAIYYGTREKAIEHLLLPCKVWVNTPFMLAAESIEAAMIVREWTGKPLTYNPMPVVGFATPVTPSGALALITAEVIGVNAISLAVDDCLCGWCASPLHFDMKSAIDVQWGPEVLIIGTAQTHIASHLFGTKPSVRLMASTRANVPGVQSMTERAFAVGMGLMAGIRNFGSLSTLANSDVGSIVQLVMDMELIEAAKYIVRGFDVVPEEMDADFIVETANKGARFMETDHTAAHYRKYQWFPELLDRQVPGAWKENPTDMLEKARQVALKKIRTAQNKCPLEPYQKKELMRLLNAADKELNHNVERING
ncbi:trimethylamine methyltransferase family protein [candidate division KSB1 bacterium]|nr:trimethylamine methyltransferase family protein [candidate division KSB1 bacterium]